MAILITGGAGYIGSHAVKILLDKGEQVVSVDNLVKGHESAITGGKFYKGDIRDREFLNKIMCENEISGVIHFAASSLVGDSMRDPRETYENNLDGAMSLLDAMQKHSVKKIVFSSTAATYGEPKKTPIEETDEQLPVNTYGETKLSIERMLKWYGQAYGIKSVALRYFNVAGAYHTGEIGEDHRPETHLIPIVLQVSMGKREKISLYGNDYPTPDGTCIRDYIHVADLIDAHLLALDYKQADGSQEVFNLGSGEGFSNMQILAAAREVTGHPIPSEYAPRRDGDPAVLIASSKKAIDVLNWKPKYTDIKSIIETAWKWHKSHPEGYAD